MVMSSIEIKVPEKARQYVVNGTISHGKAAELLGMRKTEFLQLYGSVGIPYLDMTDNEFEEEIQTVKRFTGNKG